MPSLTVSLPSTDLAARAKIRLRRLELNMGGLPVGPFCQDAGGISGPAPSQGIGLEAKE